MEYRITFSPNNLEPFTWLRPTFESACSLGKELADFDLGIYDTLTKASERMIAAYKAYRRKHGINHPDLICISTCTIDKKINGCWWIVSEDLENEDEEPYLEAFDNNLETGNGSLLLWNVIPPAQTLPMMR